MKLRLSDKALGKIYPTKRKGDKIPVKRTHVRQLGRDVAEHDVVDVDADLARILIDSGLMSAAAAEAPKNPPRKGKEKD